VQLDDGGTYRASKAQSWLWRNWTDYWLKVNIAAEGAPVWCVVNGDVFENAHHGITQLWSLNQADWQLAAAQCFTGLPIERLFVVRGTEAHAGPSAHLEEQFGRDMGAESPGGDLATFWSLDLEVAGVVFNICHRGPLGRLPWTRSNMLNRLAYELMDEAAHNGRRVPDVALRAHNHMAEENSPRSRIRVFAMPAWQLRTAYVNSKGLPQVADVGGMVFTCEAGEWTHTTHLYRPSSARPWSLKTT
jgi:hypothetical protein